MAMAEAPARPHDRHGRRRPFSNWMKRLTNLKGSSSDSNSAGAFSKRGHGPIMLKNKKNTALKNNPYPLSGTVGASGSSRRNENVYSSGSSEQQYVHRSSSEPSLHTSISDNQIPFNSAKSTAPTISTNGDTYSKAGTMATGGRGVNGGGEGSTFSSPAPSVRSLTTTLTTVQSTAPSTHLYGAQNGHGHNSVGLPHVSSTQSSGGQQVQFSHQFPPSSLSAVPPHVFNSHPTTYSSATANGLLTDNASILTLASSSKRRRRNSLDTNASIRALAPSSIFGGSRESLPLSVLSANVGEVSTGNASGVHSRPSIGGLASAERASVYSTSGAGPFVSGGDRSSYIAGKQGSGTGDTGSVRSDIHSHTRNDSAAGTVGSALTSPAVGPPSATTGRISRRSSGWGELTGDGDGEDDEAGRTDPGTEEPDQAKEVPLDDNK
ncbi:hypothetical protein VTN77DRAFT_6005 [Rasamsonia byssochlamydoides]|uniref:uncharacterized protein n=1 Tax=Rasamsonia byssochlamydoides TaxID=89139 RepID=UPI0037427CF7